MRTITKKMGETFNFIKKYLLKNGIAPTEQEIADGIGIKSRGVVHRYVHQLQEAGLLKVTPGYKRNIKLSSNNVFNNTQFAHLPVVNSTKEDKQIDLSKIISSGNFAVEYSLSPQYYDPTNKTSSPSSYYICEHRDEDNIKENDLVVIQSNNTIVLSEKRDAIPDTYEIFWGVYIAKIEF